MSKDAVRQDLTIRRGDDWGDEVTLTFLNGDGTPMDITGAEIWFSIRDAAVRDPLATDATHPPIVQITSPAVVGGPGGILPVDAAAGTARPSLTPEQTKLLVQKRYSYDVQIRPGVGALTGKIKTTQWGAVEPLSEQTLST